MIALPQNLSRNNQFSVLLDGYYINKPRGLGRYLRELVYSLSEYCPEFAINIAIPSHARVDDLKFNSNVKFHFFSSVPFPIWEQIVMPWVIRKLNPQIVHFPYNTKPIVLNFLNRPHIVTIHDLMFLDPNHKVEGMYQKLGNLYRKMIVTKSNMKKSSRAVVTVSHHTSTEIKHKLELSSHVVYTSVDYFLSKKREHDPPIYNKPYFFHVGGISPHKNTQLCIDAFIKSNVRDFDLVISGLPSDAALVKKNDKENIYFTGLLEDHEILNLYLNAYAVLFPSLREGYGLPIIEAFACNVPVITSNLEPMNEISGKAALLVNPMDVEDVSKAIIRITADKGLREHLIMEGQKRIKEINSKAMANQMRMIYRSALHENINDQCGTSGQYR